MSKDLELFAGDSAGQMPTKDIASSLRRSSLDRDTSNRFVESLDGRELLKFVSRTQKWVFGKDGERLGDETLAVNPGSFVHGICCWTGGNNSSFVDEIMVPITADLPEQPADWEAQGETNRQYQVDLQILDGEFKSEPLRFRVNSYGGVTAVQDLAGKLADRLEEDHNGYFVPVVELSFSTYSHATWGELGNPIFDVVDWMNADGQHEPEGVKPKAVEKKAKAKEVNPEPAKDSAEPEEKPPRRRRRA